MMLNKAKRIRAGAVSALAAAILCGSSSIPITHADSPAVSYGSFSGQRINAPLIKPQWTAAVDPNSNATVSDNGLVLSFSGKKLVALNLATGKPSFTYGSNLKPSVQYVNGTAYGISEDGRVYAVNVKTGKAIWQTTAGISDADAPVVIGDTVYVSKKNALIALEATTGKQRWKAVNQAEYGVNISMEEDGVVFVSYLVSGAYTYSQLDAIDKKTGKELWKASLYEAPIAVRDGLVYSKKEQSMFEALNNPEPDTPNLTFSVLDAKTGKEMGQRVYSWTRSNTPSHGVSGSTLLSGNDFYLTTENAIQKYDFSHYEKDGKPLQKWAIPYNSGRLIGSVHAGRIYFSHYDTKTLTGMKLADGQEVSWGPDNPPVQTDIYGNGVYIGQSDGVFHGYNLQTTAPAFTVNTGSRNYGPTLRSGNTLIIQAKDTGKLIAVPVPKALQ
ncbi:PQQ-binding-like beta-propeller repeat protein [Paenibacillus sp. KQZ6P-2]|uniref:PQQ-binding-like beta-propeller repeat protein n=1 Tax=Paenibacillus mangrovi TaxID=2931978 RepID=A0A9X1WQ75_9BACL|nr:PQQ-binding-like beta-propeller repeat protein [Paenibacillus mangrovi]MCJ8011950.1 PQQ-binding-like beta-propeller repeat protein [Paenibacillus mangrovi]